MDVKIEHVVAGMLICGVTGVLIGLPVYVTQGMLVSVPLAAVLWQRFRS